MQYDLKSILRRALESHPNLSKDFAFTIAPTGRLADLEDIVTSDASGDYRYLAFISYSHSNEDWGKWAQRSLESFRIPSRLAGSPNEYGVIPKKVFPIFRDRDELSASAELSDSIREALEDTRFLLVICSRSSAKSHWVNQEIKLFKSFAGSKRVLCLIVDGEPHARAPEEECFPTAIKYEVTRNGDLTDIVCEPMAADARSQGDGKFNAKLKILAALLGVRYDDLRQRERIRLRRKRILSLSLAALVATVFIGSFALYRQQSVSERNQRIASNLVDTLATDNLSQALQTIDRLADYRFWADRELLSRYTAAADGTPEKYRLGLGLLATSTTPLDYLREHSLTLDVQAVAAVSEAFKPFGSQLKSSYEKAVQEDELTAEQKFVAACFLAGLAPDSTLWSQELVVELIISQILSVDPTELEAARTIFRPKKDLFVKRLLRVYGDQSQSDIHLLFAKTCLLDYCQDSPEELFEALSLSPPKDFLDFFSRLEQFRDVAIQRGLESLTLKIPASESDEMAIRRQANICSMLLKLGQQESVWPVLQSSPNPSVRTQLIHWIPKQNIAPELLFDQYEKESREDVRHSLLLTLGEYSESELPVQTRKRYSRKLLEDYVTVEDSGTHGAIDWLLRQWGLADEVDALDESMAGKPREARNWFINGQGQTFAIIKGGVFQKGAPEWRPVEFWLTYGVKIDRTFALASKEVTRGEWRRFSDEREDVWQADQKELAGMILSDKCTMKGLTWYEAARYCNWLSEQEGIPEEEWCFIPNKDGKFANGMRVRDNFLTLTGYRLPTDSEWEFACRAGTESLWFHGNIKNFVSRYGYLPSGSICHPVGQLKPNGYGVFDLLGNGSNWMIDLDLPRYEEENRGELTAVEVDALAKMRAGECLLDRPIQQPVVDTTSRKFRGYAQNSSGGSFVDNSCHVNDRILDANLSVRLARTIKAAP